MKNKVCSIVVTNNRIVLLKRCIEALRKQTYKVDVLVVNNNSNDGTKEWLEEQNDLMHINQANLGSSGGVNTGCLFALKKGYEYIWLMDDDGYPSENALENLMKVPKFGNCVLNSIVLDSDNSDMLAFPIWVNMVKYVNYVDLKVLDIDYIIGSVNPFNGTLVHKNVFDIAGLPHGDMFIWGDETEFISRVQKFNMQVITVMESVFYHPIAKEINNTDWINNIAWRKYYSTRNLYRILKNRNNRFAGLRFTKAVLNILINIVKHQKTHKFRKFLMIIAAYIHAVTNKFGLSPNQIKSVKYFFENK